MSTVSGPAIAAGLFVAALAAGCATTTSSSRVPAAAPRLGELPPYSDADVDFMSGMIAHHAQALIMAGWAPSHGARKDVAILCERIVVGQRDEIELMQTWLRDRGLPVPDASKTRHTMKMPNGVVHDMLMPGMLTDEEMAELDRARGPEFDRLFLLGMIKHHQGAIEMVEVLFKAHGAAQDDSIFKFANDVYADQSIEIDRMNKMLEGGGRPE
jgi:uncharacterized protein (DUF305 family)